MLILQLLIVLIECRQVTIVRGIVNVPHAPEITLVKVTLHILVKIGF